MSAFYEPPDPSYRRQADEIDRLTKAIQDIYNVPWTSSGRGELTTQTNYAIALAHKDRIAREALGIDEEDQP